MIIKVITIIKNGNYTINDLYNELGDIPKYNILEGTNKESYIICIKKPEIDFFNICKKYNFSYNIYDIEKINIDKNNYNKNYIIHHNYGLYNNEMFILSPNDFYNY